MAFISEELGLWSIKLSESLSDVSGALADALAEGAVTAALEKVHSSPQMGVKSAFTFGQSFGQVEALLVAHKIPYQAVSPQRWQKDLSCLTGGDKNITKDLAATMFPAIKVTHANADAFLLAAWAERRITGKRKA